MFYEDNLKLYIQHTENIDIADIQMLTMKQLAGATYVLYMCHNNKKKYVVLVQKENVLSYEASEEQMVDLFPEYC